MRTTRRSKRSAAFIASASRRSRCFVSTTCSAFPSDRVTIMFQRTERYAPRPTSFLELLERDGWRMKLYAITYGPAPLDRAIYDEALAIALANLPRPAATMHRPGVGFIICHQGRGWHYLVVNWWDNENELPQHVYVRPIEPAAPRPAERTMTGGWQLATETQAICVWDLQLIARERDAYVDHVLSPEAGPDLDAYLASRR